MGRKEDEFWKHAVDPIDSNGRFKCKYCMEEFPGGISRLKSHLSGLQGRDIDICPSVPADVRADAQQAIGSPCKKGKNLGISNNENSIGDNSTRSKRKCSESEKKALDKKLMKFQIANGISKEASQLFVEFLKAVGDFGPNYELPNCCSRDELVTEYDWEISRYERDVKDSWTETGCTLMIITEEARNPLELKVFAHCPKGTLFLASVTCDGEYSDMIQAIEGIDTLHIVQVILHCADTLVSLELLKLVTLVRDRFPRVFLASPSLTLVIPTLHLVTCGDVWISRLILAGKMIFKYMRKFSTEMGRTIFDKWKEYKRLGHMYPLIFPDYLLLLHSIVDLEADLVRVVQSLDTSSHPQDLAKWITRVVMDAKFWALMKEVCHIFDLLLKFVHLANSKVPSFGYLYEAMTNTRNAIDECFRKDPTRYEKIKSFWYEQLGSGIRPLHAAACFLNPAVMCSEKFKEDSMMKEGIDYIAHNVVDESDRDTFLHQVEIYRAKTPDIFTDTALQMLKTLQPRLWWHYFGDSVPVLQKCAIRILSQPCDVPPRILDLVACSSSSSSSNNNNNSNDERRMKLLMMEKFSVSEPSSLEPIDLDRLARVCEYVKQEDLDDLSDSGYTDKTFESLSGEEDLLLFWLENEHELKHCITT